MRRRSTSSTSSSSAAASSAPGVALDAVTRGLTVGLFEGRDWAAGTSSRSSKLVHGGLRYLEMLDFGLVREALRERGLLAQRLAPHLVRPVPFLYPLKHRGWERLYAGAGVALYDTHGRLVRALPRPAPPPAPVPDRGACGSRRRCARTPWSAPSSTTTRRSTTPGTPPPSCAPPPPTARWSPTGRG